MEGGMKLRHSLKPLACALSFAALLASERAMHSQELIIDVTGTTNSPNLTISGSGTGTTIGAGGFPLGFGVDESGNIGILGDVLVNANQNFENANLILSGAVEFRVNGANSASALTLNIAESADPNGNFQIFGPLSYNGGDMIAFTGSDNAAIAGLTNNNVDAVFNAGTYQIVRDGVTFTVNIIINPPGGGDPVVIIESPTTPTIVVPLAEVIAPEIVPDPFPVVDTAARTSAEISGEAVISSVNLTSFSAFNGFVRGIHNRIRRGASIGDFGSSGAVYHRATETNIAIAGAEERWTGALHPIAGVAAPPISVDTWLADWELFTMGSFNLRDQEQLGLHPGYDADAFAGTVGLERFVNQQLLVGFASTLGRNEAEIGGNLGGVDIDGVVLDAYAIYARDHLWTSLRYGVGFLDHDISRRAASGVTPRAETESLHHVITWGGGLNLPVTLLGMEFIHGPNLGLEYMTGQIDGYTEQGGDTFNLIVDDHNYASLVSEIGWAIAREHDLGKLGRGFLQLRASWNSEHLLSESRTEYQFETSPISIFDPATGRSTAGPDVRGSADNPTPQDDYAVVGLHLTQLLGAEERWTFHAGYQTQLFRSDFSEHYGYVRLGSQF